MRKGPAVAAMLAAGALIAIAIVVALREPAAAPARASAPQADSAPDRGATAAPAEAAASQAALAPAATGAAETRDGNPAPAPSAVARLDGRVLVRDEGVPVPGVAVDVLTRGPGGAQAWQVVVADADGRFRFDFSEAVELLRLVAGAGPATASALVYADGSLVPPAQRTLDIEVTRGAGVSGRVVDEGDAPAVGVLVQSFDASPFDIDAGSRPQRETRTDTAGHFDLQAVGSPVTILASAPGRACVIARSGEPLAGHTYADIDLRLGAAREIDGRVVDDSGTGISGAQLHVEAEMAVAPAGGFVAFEPWPFPTSSDASGRFGLVLPVDWSGIAEFPFTVDHADFASWSGRLPTESPATIVLSRGFALTGVVTGTDGAPIPGASLRAVSHLANATTTSSADGSYRLGGLPQGKAVDLFTHAAGHAILVEQELVPGSQGDTRHDITLGPGRALAGRVTDAAGQPAGGVRVGIEGDRLRRLDVDVIPKPTWEGCFRLDSALTDHDGRFRIPDLYDGAFSVTARSPDDSETIAVVTTNTPDEHIELVLPDPELTRIHLHGRISDAITGAPIEHAQFTFMKDTWGTPREVAAPLGQYDLLGPMAGSYQLLVGAAGYTQFSDKPRDWTAGRQPLDVTLLPVRALVVQVVRADGTPVADAGVAFRNVDGALLQFGSSSGLSTGMTTDDGGQLRAIGLPAQQIVVSVRSNADIAQQTVDLLADADQTVRIVLQPRATRRLDLAVCLGHKSVQAPADADTKTFHELLGKHHLQPYSGPATLVARDADGNVVAQASAGVDGDHIVEQCNDAGGLHTDTFSIAAVEFLLTVTPDALTLELDVPGYATWRSELPAGMDVVHRVAVLKDS